MSILSTIDALVGGRITELRSTVGVFSTVSQAVIVLADRTRRTFVGQLALDTCAVGTQLGNTALLTRAIPVTAATSQAITLNTDFADFTLPVCLTCRSIGTHSAAANQVIRAVVVFEALDTGAVGRLAKRGRRLTVSIGAATKQLACPLVAILGIIAARFATSEAAIRPAIFAAAIRDAGTLALAADSVASLAGVAAIIGADSTAFVSTATFALAIGQAINTFSRNSIANRCRLLTICVALTFGRDNAFVVHAAFLRRTIPV